MADLKFEISKWSLAVLAVAAGRAFAAEPAGVSEWVHRGADGKLVYKTTERGDRIMDFSFAGYMGGGVKLPDVAVKRTVKPSGGEDDGAAIQKAIDEVSALPLEGGFRGAVVLEPGVYPCSQTVNIAADGVVLRGSGSSGERASTLKLVGRPHLGISVGGRGGGRREGATDAGGAATTIADAYVPSGAASFDVEDAGGLAAGDWVSIRRPVTAAWVKFMHMADMVRDGRPQTWIKVGNATEAVRKVAKVEGKRVTVDVPLSDSFDAAYLNPPGTSVVTVAAPKLVSQCGVEDLHIESPAQAFNHTQAHFQAMRVNGQDCWARDVAIDETMNSVGVTGRRVTLTKVSVTRKARHEGASKPAEFAPNGTQVLMDRCSVTADNVWFVASGAGVSGPVVVLNCTFDGNGRAESHQRWSTGLLYDNCRAPGGGLEMRNRGSMGSGHGWSMGWGVMWNCVAKEFLVQDPPGAINWEIGCVGEDATAARPFGKAPALAGGTVDSHGTPVAPRSLYLAQLAERLGKSAMENIGYRSAEDLGGGK